MTVAELDLFEAQRPRLFAVAYRMLGSATDAEDVCRTRGCDMRTRGRWICVRRRPI